MAPAANCMEDPYGYETMRSIIIKQQALTECEAF